MVQTVSDYSFMAEFRPHSRTSGYFKNSPRFSRLYFRVVEGDICYGVRKTYIPSALKSIVLKILPWLLAMGK